MSLRAAWDRLRAGGVARLRERILPEPGLGRLEAAVFLTALGVRLLLWIPVLLRPELAFQPDSVTYLRLAVHLAEHHRYLSILRPPLYPAFLAALGCSPSLAIVAQGLLDAVTAVLVLRLCRAFGGDRRRSGFGGFLYAVAPLPAFYSVQLMSESLFSFLLVLTLHAWARIPSSSGPGAAVMTGALAAALAYCRSVGLLIPALLAAMQFLRERARARDGGAAPPARGRGLLLLAVFAGLVLPYCLYNQGRSGLFGITNVWHCNTAFYTAPALRELERGGRLVEFATDYGVFMRRARREHWAWIRRELGWSEPDDIHLQDHHLRVRQAVRIALEEMARSPARLAALHAVGALRQFVPGDSVERTAALIGVPFAVVWGPVALLHLATVVLAVLGLKRAYAEGGPVLPLVLLLAVAAVLILTPGAGAESDRFSLPAIPLAAVLAAWAIPSRKP